MKPWSLIAFVLLSAMIIPGMASARGRRIDNPGHPCDMLEWITLGDDPYLVIDGNKNGKLNQSTFFVPGTVITGDKVAVCSPKEALSKIWAGDSAQLPNPASIPGETSGPPVDADLTAKSAVMYEWNNSSPPDGEPAPAPDVQVVVWSIAPSTVFPSGAFEIELDNWCASPGTSGTTIPPNPSASITWNGNVYTAACSSFGTSATDLLLNRSGVILGYVDGNNDTQVTTTIPGWQVSLRTMTSLAISPNPASSTSTVKLEGAVAGLLGGPSPTGTVTFFNGTTALGSGTLDAAGVATFSATKLSAGSYSVTAAYGGDGNHAASTSAAQTLTVTP